MTQNTVLAKFCMHLDWKEDPIWLLAPSPTPPPPQKKVKLEDRLQKKDNVFAQQKQSVPKRI